MNRSPATLAAPLIAALCAGPAAAADFSGARIGHVPHAHPVVVQHVSPAIAMKPVIYRPIVSDAVLFRPIVTPPTAYFHPQAVTHVYPSAPPPGACPVSTPVRRCR
jgi:hypothetical protein